jgi:hypothetical protein
MNVAWEFLGDAQGAQNRGRGAFVERAAPTHQQVVVTAQVDEDAGRGGRDLVERPLEPCGAVAEQRAEALAERTRRVRLGGGATKADRKYYTTGKGKGIGSKRKVSSLINDGVKRIFTDQAELEAFANGTTDYIGDVKTASSGTFWYRLPENSLTILGEIHHDAQGNVPDVIKAFGTKRFMYEPFNELVPTTALPVATPSDTDRAMVDWKARKTKSDYSGGERVAL